MTGDKNFMEALSIASGFSVDELKEVFQYGALCRWSVFHHRKDFPQELLFPSGIYRVS